MFLVGSPMCTQFSSWQYLSAQSKEPAESHRAYVQAMVHMRFMMELYREQEDQGRYFLHEHPAYATSWNEECVEEIKELEHVETVVGDRCQYGQESRDGDPVKKATRWMSNSQEVLRMLSRRCAGHNGHCSRPSGGEHVTVAGSEAKRSQIFPFTLCKAILTGFRKQLIADGRLVLGVAGVQRPEEDLSDAQLERIVRRSTAVLEGVELHHIKADEEFKDAITGQALDPGMVRAARRRELEYFAAKTVWKKVPRSDAQKYQGKPPITVKWVDVNKGDDESPNYRSRLVAREVRHAWESSIFSPTPPLESLRSILSLAASDIPGVLTHDRHPESPRRTQISIIDIARAYFNAKVDPEHPV